MKSFHLGLAFFAALTLSQLTGCAADTSDTETAPTEDELATGDRAKVMDALRAELKPRLKNQDIVFNVSQGTLKFGKGDRAATATNDFAFLFGSIQLKNGGKVDYTGTEYQEYIDEGIFDDNVAAVFRKDGNTWTCLTFSVGSTDVPWVYWAWEHGVPRDIFPAGSVSDTGPIAEDAAPLAGAELAAAQNDLAKQLKGELANQDIVFELLHNQAANDASVAFFFGHIRLRSGGEVDYSQTEYQQYIDEGLFDDNFAALLVKTAGGWKLEAHSIGSTDVAWSGWDYEYSVPSNLFPGATDAE